MMNGQGQTVRGMLAQMKTAFPLRQTIDLRL